LSFLLDFINVFIRNFCSNTLFIGSVVNPVRQNPQDKYFSDFFDQVAANHCRRHFGCIVNTAPSGNIDSTLLGTAIPCHGISTSLTAGSRSYL